MHHYRQTSLVHLGDSDTLTIERDRAGTIGATVRDATGNTVARVEFIGRLDQLDGVALAAAEDEPEAVPVDDSDIMPGSEFDGPVAVR